MSEINPFEFSEAVAPKGQKATKNTASNPFEFKTPPTTPGGFATKNLFPEVTLNDSVASYAKRGVPLNPLLNLDEERARRQSTSEKWLNGTAKMFLTAGSAFADGTVGVAVGLGNALIGESFYDNPFGRGVDEFNEWMQKELPNYYTQAEMQKKGLESLGTANFWADKALNGVGYMAGNIASVMVGTGALNIGSKALQGYRLAKAVSTGTKASKLFNTSSRIAAKSLNATRTATIGAISAASESAVEARQALRNAEQRLTQEAVEEMGVLNENYLPAWKKQEIKDQATTEGNIAFALNMAIVGGSNLVTFGNLLLPKYLQARPKVSGISRASKASRWVDTVGDIPTWRRTGKAIGSQLGKGAVTEAYQEGMQYAIGEASEEMGDLWSAGDGLWESATAIPDMFEALGKSYIDAFGSKEGLDSMMVGAIVGMLGGGRGALQEITSRQNQDATRARLLNSLNNPQLFNAIDRAEQSQESMMLSSQMMSALERGDHKTFRDKQMDLLINEAIQFEQAGRMDLLMERLEDELDRDPESFKEVWGFPPEMNVNQAEIINGLKNNLRKFQNIKETIDARYPDLEPYNFPQKKFRSKEEAADRLLQIQSQRAYKNALYKTAFKLEDIDGRIEKLAIELGDMSGTSLTDALTNLPLDASLKKLDVDKTLKAFEALEDARQKVIEKSPQKTREFGEKADDALSLLKDRADAIIAINNLEGTPEEQAAYLQLKENEAKEKARKVREESFKKGVENATTLEELEDLINGVTDAGEVSDEARAMADDKYTKLKEDVLNEDIESNYKSVDALIQEASKEEDPIRKKRLEDIIARRTEAGQLDALEKRPETKSSLPDDGPKSPFAEDAEAEAEADQDEVRKFYEAQAKADAEAAANGPKPGKSSGANVNANNLSVKQILDILREDLGIVLSKDKTKYVVYDDQGNVIKEWARVSDLKGGKAAKEPGSTMDKAAARGTIIDDVFRQAVVTFNKTGKHITAKDVEEIYKQHELRDSTNAFMPRFLQDLAEQITEIISDYNARGYVLETDFPPVFGEIKGKSVAGTVDFIAYHKTDGRIHILDLKTSTVSRRAQYKKGPNKGWYLRADAIQLVAYAELIRQRTGFNPVQNKIIPMQTIKSAGVDGKYRRAVLEAVTLYGKKRYALGNPYLKEARLELGIAESYGQAEFEETQGVDRDEDSARRAIAELEAAEGAEVRGSLPGNNKTPLPSQSKKPRIVSAKMTQQGSLLEFEIINPQGKERLLTVDRKGKLDVYTVKNEDGTYYAGEPLPQEIKEIIYNNSIPRNIQNLIKEWVISMKGEGWASLDTPLGVLHKKISDELESTFSVLNGLRQIDDLRRNLKNTDQNSKQKKEASRRKHSAARLPDRPSLASGELRQVRIGQFMKVIVDEQGNHILGNDLNQKLPDGTPLNINRTFLKNASQQDIDGALIELRVLDTQWSTDPENITQLPLGQPIGVYALVADENGSPQTYLLGMLPDGNSPSATEQYKKARLAILESLRKGNAITGNIEKVHPGNPISTYKKTSNGEYVQAFFPIAEATEGVENIILTSAVEGGGMRVSQAMQKSLPVDVQENLTSLSKESGEAFRVVPGRILVVSNRPGAKTGLGVIPAYTALMDKTSIEAVTRIATRQENLSNIANDIKDIVGLPYNYSAKSTFYVTDHEKFGDAVFYFSDQGGDIIRITNTELQKAVANEGFVKFSIGRFVTKTAEIIDEETGEVSQSIIYDENGKPIVSWENLYADQYQELKNLEGLDEDAKKAYRANVSKIVSAHLKRLRPTLVESFQNSLSRQYRQVSLDRAFKNMPYQSKVTGNVYNTYMEYLSSPEELFMPQNDKTSILTMDSKAHNGSLYYDINAEFSTFESTPSRERSASQPQASQKDNNSNSQMKSESNKPKVSVDVGRTRRRTRPRSSEDKKGEDLKNQCNGL